jgi:hypothetical protein
MSCFFMLEISNNYVRKKFRYKIIFNKYFVILLVFLLHLRKPNKQSNYEKLQFNTNRIFIFS